MLDLSKLEKYRENNRIEAKKAVGGLPQSIWETYSAFANTLGGIILLGVEEYSDKSLHAVKLPSAEKLVKEFWDTVNNPNKVNRNILFSSDVKIETADGLPIVVISVPRAQRADKPIYIADNPLTGTYRRNGEGDYRCSSDEIRAMLRDATVQSPDSLLLEDTPIDVFDYDCVHRYRNRMSSVRPGHVWEELGDNEFLYRIGAIGVDRNNTMHPTTAGLLMFGYEYEIVKVYPHFFLDYRQVSNENPRWTDRIISSSGDWSGNVFDFYFRVYNKLVQDIKTPFEMQNGVRIDDTPIHNALREALANCLVNADYGGKQGIVVVKGEENITFSNPGCFRMDIEVAKGGGFSDPRNIVLMKMFNLINIGERAGSGIPSIFAAWRKSGWIAPSIDEQFEPDRTTLILPMHKVAIKSGDKKVAIKSGDKRVAAKTVVRKEEIIGYLTDHPSAKSAELSQFLDLAVSRVKTLLSELIADGIVVAEGANRNRTYRLKS